MAPVGSFALNDFGVHDMSGNVAEWCADVHDDGWYAAPEARRDNPANTPDTVTPSALRSVRGGHWYTVPYSGRSARRGGHASAHADAFLGFRAARTP